MNKEDTVTKENYNEQMDFPNTWEEFEMDYGFYDTNEVYTNGSRLIQSFRVKQWLKHQMTAEEYRQRIMQAFHNADCDRLIAICALPTEKEFEHLEWLLKTHYKKKSCEDAISRQAVLMEIDKYMCGVPYEKGIDKVIKDLPPVTPKPKTGRWIKIKPYPLQMHEYECSECSHETDDNTENYCSDCGAKMEIGENEG